MTGNACLKQEVIICIWFKAYMSAFIYMPSCVYICITIVGQVRSGHSESSCRHHLDAQEESLCSLLDKSSAPSPSKSHEPRFTHRNMHN